MSYPSASTFDYPAAVSPVLKLRSNLATSYLAAVDVLRDLEAQQNAITAARRERLRAELDAVDVVPLTNPADQRW
ncbi:hypothetical protein [Nocardiopsis sp. NRRL B-16309]|uniref:hypothetical protein n=1 Tax=Nocardiopsis sp. NRRL B-16309 TaxID=1519494 RepID=UPI0006B01C11|nr:hypothetical protein [Nocardiopsis sp. NRRL B-16309]KOX19051.1 hypothetical protein ADL05_06115 [Nocardiopsis sp. NRRL B-16309]